MKKAATTVLGIAAAAAIFLAGRGCGRMTVSEPGLIETRIDTIIVRDTLRDTVLVPVESIFVRTDTVWMQAAGDTVWIEVAVPTERKVYATDDYRAVVEGFRPALVEMEIYRSTTRIIRENISRKPSARWGAGIQAGYGFGPKGAVPYIGIGIQYSLIVW